MPGSPRSPLPWRIAGVVLAGLWLWLLADSLWVHALEFHLPRAAFLAIQWSGFSGVAALLVLWLIRLACGNQATRDKLWLAATVAYIPLWHWLVFAADQAGLDGLRVMLAQGGLGGLFCVGLAWVVWLLESAAERVRRRKREALSIPGTQRQPRSWNPLDPDAWFYGQSRKLSQTLAAFCSYSFAFCLAFLMFSRISGCQELYEAPAGGGKPIMVSQQVKIQKVIKKKFVINPFSAIVFNPPPIDDVKLNLAEATAHLYKVGDGSGEGAGFSGGTARGKVRFIRLEYQGGDWDQDFGVGADQNMLIQYGVLTQQKVHTETESRSIAQLKAFPAGKSPPLMYLTGQRNITLSSSEAKILREYLLEKHGMLFGDNGGSGHFHNQFFAMMREVLPNVEPVHIPLDDVIHRVPYPLPFLPYVAPHGGREAWGWKVDGRWVCYYHPGDIGDAWADGHSNVPRPVWEACYQLGTNVIFYAHAEYNQWLEAQKRK